MKLRYRDPILLIIALSPLACGLTMSSADKDKLAAACEGQAVAGAGAHEGGAAGFISFKKDEQGDAFAYDVDGVHFKLKRPKKLAETQTVFCMEAPEEIDAGVCAFDTVKGVGVAGIQVAELGRSEGPTFARVSMQRSGRLVDPSTGETIAEHTVTIEAPACESFTGEPSESSFRAITPTGISFGDWALEQLGVSE